LIPETLPCGKRDRRKTLIFAFFQQKSAFFEIFQIPFVLE